MARNTQHPQHQQDVKREPAPSHPEREKNPSLNSSLYDTICDLLDTKRESEESTDDFKVRVCRKFSDKDLFPDEDYNRLPSNLQDWIWDTIQTYKANRDRKRHKMPLPFLEGLDVYEEWSKTKTPRRRPDLDSSGRNRSTGDDCLTRTMTVLRDDSGLVNAKTKDVIAAIKTRYHHEYSYAAVRYAQLAWRTAQRLLGVGDPNPPEPEDEEPQEHGEPQEHEEREPADA